MLYQQNTSWAHHGVTYAKNASVPDPRAWLLGEGSAPWSVHSAADTLGYNHWCLSDSRAAFYSGPRSRRNPTQTWAGFLWATSALWFEKGKFSIFPILSQNSFHTTIVLSVMTPPHPHPHQRQLRSFIGVFPINEGWGWHYRPVANEPIYLFVSRNGDSPIGNHSHSSTAWFRHKQDG